MAFDDIRTVPPEEYWDHFEQQWTNLLSYRYLGRRNARLDAGVEHDSMPLRHDMRNPAGGIMAAPLCIASPETGGLDDDVAVPNPVIHSLQVLDDAAGVRRVDVLSETISQGRTMAFSRSRIVDADDHRRVIALSTGMGISLGTPPEGFTPVENPSIELADSPDLPPLHQVFGASRRDDGHWVLPELSAELSSPDAALHLGPIHIVLETAATELAAAQLGTDRLQVEDWYVMFVARGKVGPFRASGEATAGSLGRAGVRLALHDEGNADRVVTTASATFRAVS